MHMLSLRATFVAKRHWRPKPCWSSVLSLPFSERAFRTLLLSEDTPEMDSLSPAKVLLLAVHLAASADVDGLGCLAAQHGAILRREVLLRIILTHLPETITPSTYVPLLQAIANENVESLHTSVEIDTSIVEGIADDVAAKKARKLHLMHLVSEDTPEECNDDTLSLFLFQRTYRMNRETGIVSLLPQLLLPFVEHSPVLRTWIISTVIPFVRRTYDYHTPANGAHNLLDFQKLPDRAAADYLLSQTGLRLDEHDNIGRDFRGIVGPWLYNTRRWKAEDSQEQHGPHCPGWEQILEHLLSWNSKSWPVSVGAIEQWGGPRDIDFGEGLLVSLEEEQQSYLEETYIRAAIAAAYTIPESTLEALGGAYRICSKAWTLIGQECDVDLEIAVRNPEFLPAIKVGISRDPRMVAHLRTGFLEKSNTLTSPTPESLTFITTLALSAYIATKLGLQWSIRRAGELFFLQDERDQKGEVSKIIRFISNQAPKDDEGFWRRARQTILWLYSWNLTAVGGEGGVLGAVQREYIETEILKALLSKSMYSLARSLYEDQSDLPLSRESVQEIVYNSSLNAFDNASNPNRTRGGLKKSDEIIHAFPKTLNKTNPSTKKVEALLKASHALSEYRLVLKQGEPFSPVVLRVHSDPVAVIERVLEQNPRAYTRLQEFLEMGSNMVNAGLLSPRNPAKETPESKKTVLLVTEKRIISMCIEAALREDDFETAYSYVVSRLGSSSVKQQEAGDEWSWSAALKAGQYIRTERSQQPTHLGTASGNLEIRHLEQRIECLATALRVAPSAELQNILKSFRRCEEQLDSAIKEEAANEAAWDAAGDMTALPGGFDVPVQNKPAIPRNMTASTAARQAEEAPMSLFDLSRATARIAQRNFTAFGGQQGASAPAPTHHEQDEDEDEQNAQRVRKRDQLRDAATGTLVSGVGWLIGATPRQE